MTVQDPVATIEMPFGGDLLISANHRGHWASKARKTRAIREIAGWKARDAGPVPTPTRLIVWVQWPDRRRRDEHNLAPTSKAAIDGFVDGGLIPDDSGEYLIGPDFRRDPELCEKRFAVVLRFEFHRIGEHVD